METLENLRKRKKVCEILRNSSETGESLRERRKRQKVFGNVRKSSETLKGL